MDNIQPNNLTRVYIGCHILLMEVCEYRVVNNFRTISTKGTLISCLVACMSFSRYVGIVASGENDLCRVVMRMKRRVK